MFYYLWYLLGYNQEPEEKKEEEPSRLYYLTEDEMREKLLQIRDKSKKELIETTKTVNKSKTLKGKKKRGRKGKKKVVFPPPNKAK